MISSDIVSHFSKKRPDLPFNSENKQQSFNLKKKENDFTTQPQINSINNVDSKVNSLLNKDITMEGSSQNASYGNPLLNSGDKQNDYILDQIINKENQIKCPLHKKEEILYFCFNEDCPNNLVCNQCIIDKLHINHNVKNLDKLSEFWIDMIKEYELKIKYSIDSLKLFQEKNYNSINLLKNGENNLKNRLISHFKELRKVLDFKEQEILNYISDKFNNIHSQNIKLISDLEKKMDNLSVLFKRIDYAENYSILSIIDIQENFNLLKNFSLENANYKEEIDTQEDNQIRFDLSKIFNELNNLKKQTNEIKFEHKCEIIGNDNSQNEIMDHNQNNSSFTNVNQEIVFKIEKKNINNKQKIFKKYDQIMEAFEKPSFLKNDNSKFIKNNEIFKTPQKNKLNFNSSENNHESHSYLGVLSKQKIKFFSSASKLI